MDNLDTASQEVEFKKCAEDFVYFCETYAKINHYLKGNIPFKLHEYQKRYIEFLREHRFLINKKFRQGGFSTLNVVWLCWRFIFKTDERNMVVAKTDREAILHSAIAKTLFNHLPEWMKPNFDKFNDHQFSYSDNNNIIWFYAFEAARGKMMNYIFIDEAAFIKNMDCHWKAIWPVLSTGGHCIVTSTVNGTGNWFHETYMGSVNGLNDFKAFHWDYKEHPDYNNEEWVKQIKANLGEKGWQQEVLCEFLESNSKPEPISAEKPDLKPHENWFIVKTLKEEKEVLHKCRKRAYERGYVPNSTIKDSGVKEPVLCHNKGEDITQVSFDNVSRPNNFHGYWWPNIAEEMAEEQIFLNEDYTLYNSIEKKRENLKDLEARVEEGLYIPEDLLVLSGVAEPDEKFDTYDNLGGDVSKELLDKIVEMGRFSETLKITFDNKVLCINKVPTSIEEFSLCCLYNGLLAFTTHKKALEKVAKIVVRKMKPLFGGNGGR